MTDGDFRAKFEDLTVRVGRVSTRFDQNRRLEISCNAGASCSSQNISFSAPNVRIITDDALSLKNPNIRCTLKAKGAILKSPEAEVAEVGIQANLGYDLDQQSLAFGQAAFDLNRCYSEA